MKQLLKFLLIIPFVSFIPADWLTVTLDQDVSIEFFSEPKMQDFKGNQVWTNDIEDKARCIVSSTDLTKMGMDSATVANDMAKESSMVAMGKGMLSKMPGSKINSQQKTTISGQTSFEYLIYTDKDVTSGFDRLYCTVIFHKAKMYTLYFYESAKKPQQGIRNRFLKSFKIK